MNEQEKFVISDMALASVLIFFGEPMIDVKKNDKDEIEFIFNQSLDLQNLVKGYSLGELSVEPRRFALVMKEIKKIIFTQKNNIERREI